MNENEKSKTVSWYRSPAATVRKHMNWVNTCIPNSRKNLIIRKKSQKLFSVPQRILTVRRRLLQMPPSK